MDFLVLHNVVKDNHFFYTCCAFVIVCNYMFIIKYCSTCSPVNILVKENNSLRAKYI